MGCKQSTTTAELEPHGEYEIEARPSRNTSQISNASEMTDVDADKHHDRLLKLQELDKATKIPFILVELRGCGDEDGYIEICGKDEYGVYEALDNFLQSQWHCKRMDPGDLRKNTPVPFCDKLYRWKEYRAQGSDGTSNMGLATMQLVDFMCNSLCWTLGVINGGNVGIHGEIREQQVIFKAPHPMNMVAGHIMIELRSAGYIEVCGTDREDMDILHDYLLENFNAKPEAGHEEFCNRYYSCASGVFKERGTAGENNLGLLTVKVCDAVVNKLHGWSLVTMNGGNYGEAGTHREQQLVFRCDHHPLREAPHLMVELREAGYIEVCGQDIDGIYGKLAAFVEEEWKCSSQMQVMEAFCDKKFKWKPKDFTEAAAEMTAFFHKQGWQMQVCSQGTVKIKGNPDSREQQMLFRPGASAYGLVEPHLFFELYTGEGDPELFGRHVTQVLGNQTILIKPVGDCSSALAEFDRFATEYLGGGRDETQDGSIKYHVDCFLSRGITDNNLGAWTMRFCDFMVDRLGWSFVVCNVCNLGASGEIREQQLVFRFDGERREIPAVKVNASALNWTLFPGLKFPGYWRTQDVLKLKKTYQTVACEHEEIEALQQIFDHTFKRVLTRDRVYEYQLGVSEEMPFRLEIAHAFRSEHAELYRRFARRKEAYRGGTPYKAKTLEAPYSAYLNSRLGDGEALLAHGTNPSSAMGILKTGFVLNHAGKATGTMFGYGIYLAECVSKSDEYARDDNGGTYPGLMAMLLCRCLVGSPHVVTEAGDHIQAAKDSRRDCVVGDRESKVGTYKEYIFFDETQVYPEYAVIYRRNYDQNQVPESMRQAAKGTTGRNWQVQLEKGWANVPPDVSHKLSQAEAAGYNRLDVEIAGMDYIFDLTTMRQTNKQTGKVRSIRPPMRR